MMVHSFEHLTEVVSGQVMSLNVKWLVLQQRRIGLAFVFLSVFHVLFGLLLWCLLTTTSRGPGYVGEVLHAPSKSNGTAQASIDDLEHGPATAATAGHSAPAEEESAPLVSHGADDRRVSDNRDTDYSHRRRARRAGSSPYSTEDDEDRTISEALEVHASSSSDSEANSSDDGMAGRKNTSEGKRRRNGRVNLKPHIVYPSDMRGGAALMAKANGKARFCRKVIRL